MKLKIFYSWQSDLPNKTNRGLIKDALDKALQDLNLPSNFVIEADRDTQGTTGSPNIVSTILNKIRESAIFIADVSIVNSDLKTSSLDSSLVKRFRPCPNPNVLFELGYAIGSFNSATETGWERTILICNRAYGEIEDLPFDIRQHRILGYSMGENDQPANARNYITSALKLAIESIVEKVGILGFIAVPIKNKKFKYIAEKGLQLLESGQAESLQMSFIIARAIFKSIVSSLTYLATPSVNEQREERCHIFKTIRSIKDRYRTNSKTPKDEAKRKKEDENFEIEKSIANFLGLSDNELLDFRNRMPSCGVSFGMGNIYFYGDIQDLILKDVEEILHYSIRMFSRLESEIPYAFLPDNSEDSFQIHWFIDFLLEDSDYRSTFFRDFSLES